MKMLASATSSPLCAESCEEETSAGPPYRKLRLGIDPDLTDWLHAQSERLHLSPSQIVGTLLEWARSEAVLEDLDLGVMEHRPE
jgi:hypothetical protein